MNANALLEDEYSLPRSLGVEQLVGSIRPFELEPMRQEPLEGHLPVDDEARAFGLPHDAEGPRCVNRQLTTQQVAADVEGCRASLTDERDAAPCTGTPHGGHA